MFDSFWLILCISNCTGHAVCFRRGVLGHLDCYGFADLERKVEMRPDSLVRLYSMTKCIVSAALGKCLEAPKKKRMFHRLMLHQVVVFVVVYNMCITVPFYLSFVHEKVFGKVTNSFGRKACWSWMIPCPSALRFLTWYSCCCGL